MEELLIYEYHVKLIQEALRLTSNINKCRDRVSSFDRDIMQAIDIIDNVLAKKHT